MPADTPMLFQETGVGAAMYQRVRVSGHPDNPGTSFITDRIGTLDVEVDTLAMQGRERFIDVEFVAATINLPVAHTEVIPTWNGIELGSGHVRVPAGVLPRRQCDAGEAALGRRRDPGHLHRLCGSVVTIGNPRGQRGGTDNKEMWRDAGSDLFFGGAGND